MLLVRTALFALLLILAIGNVAHAHDLAADSGQDEAACLACLGQRTNVPKPAAMLDAPPTQAPTQSLPAREERSCVPSLYLCASDPERGPPSV